MNEILDMSTKIDYGQLIYNIKGPTHPINFGKFGGVICIYNHMKNGGKHYHKQKTNKNILENNKMK